MTRARRPRTSATCDNSRCHLSAKLRERGYTTRNACAHNRSHGLALHAARRTPLRQCPRAAAPCTGDEAPCTLHHLGRRVCACDHGDARFDRFRAECTCRPMCESKHRQHSALESKLTGRVADTDLRGHDDSPLDHRVVWIVVGRRGSTARGASPTASMHMIRIYEENRPGSASWAPWRPKRLASPELQLRLLLGRSKQCGS